MRLGEETMQESTLLASKEKTAKILKVNYRTLLKLIDLGHIPGPLPGTRFLHVPSVLAALGRAAEASMIKRESV
jgi:hypothetical protein